MKFSFFVTAAVLLMLAACNKDKYQTKPTITVKSVNGTFVPLNGTLVIDIECTDKEGDVQDSLIVIKKRLNKRVVATIRDTIRYKFPAFPTTQKTLVQASLDYQSILSALSPPFIPGSSPARREVDTLLLRMAVRDKAGNTSDTVNSPTIYVFRQ